ncbi:Nucleotide-binding universal stress protein, UspA family [Jatrophihabitans endophyticus]|uniref:Nucleotide-binding universal stress protein, UspA family n=1 Tax=Jatrophihabitans endophyticus TaxID=1206085 RepID=A0A1M5HL69_9ACTN|nr:universal stress protein [Jatrophihabitans endophyticus]SHG16703.1 Nucleotide-binding universal stress protein, UspA family [Jatrophihabitans endophyticus]
MSVVVGYVPDATGLLAVRQAAQEATWRGTDVVIVNVIGASGYTTPTAADEQHMDSVAALLADGGVAHTVRTVGAEEGVRPAEAILQIADEVSADLIVVGIKRRSAVAKAVLGSTAQRVLTGAVCPVLAVRSDD